MIDKSINNYLDRIEDGASFLWFTFGELLFKLWQFIVLLVVTTIGLPFAIIGYTLKAAGYSKETEFINLGRDGVEIKTKWTRSKRPDVVRLED